MMKLSGWRRYGLTKHTHVRICCLLISAQCYWFSVEFGLCKEQGDLKAYGAGLLSSFGEIEYACAPYRPAGGEDKFPEYRPWDPKEAARTAYPITCYQPVYFVADSLVSTAHYQYRG